MVSTRRVLKRKGLALPSTPSSNAELTLQKRRKRKIDDDVQVENKMDERGRSRWEEMDPDCLAKIDDDDVQIENKMDEGVRSKWEEMDTDCLANVFGRVGMESLLLDIPFVCKSWYETSLNPLCWQRLYFPNFEPLPLFTDKCRCREERRPKSLGSFYDRFVRAYRIKTSRKQFCMTLFIKGIVNRSNRTALELKLPGFCSQEALRYVAKECPGLRVLCWPDDLVLLKSSGIIHQVIGEWKLLEKLSLGGNLCKIRADEKRHPRRHFKALLADTFEIYGKVLVPILEQIGLHCKFFTGLEIINGDIVGHGIDKKMAEWLPNLKYLWVRESYVDVNCLCTMLRECKELELLHVRNCNGLEVRDLERLQIAKYSDTEFRCEGFGYHCLKFRDMWLRWTGGAGGAA